MPLSTQMLNILASGTGYFVTLVKVTAKANKGGQTVAYALHTRDVVFEGVTYTAAPFEPSKMAQSSGVAVDNATLTHLLLDIFSRSNIKGGKWSGAALVLSAVDVTNLSAGVARRHYGRVGDITTSGQQGQTEFRGLMQLLNQDIGDRTSKHCRYQLGDADCGLNLAPFTFAGTIVSKINEQRFTVSVSKESGYFKYGRAVFTSGLNNGLDMEIISNNGQEIVLFLPFPLMVSINDALNLIAGDDKTLETCHRKFANSINFGGEPSVPNREDVFKFPE